MGLYKATWYRNSSAGNHISPGRANIYGNSWVLNDEPFLPLHHITHSTPETSNRWFELEYLDFRMKLVAGSWKKFDGDRTDDNMVAPHRATRMAHKKLPPVPRFSSATEGSRSASPPPNRWRKQWLHPGWPTVTKRCMIDVTCPCHTAGGFFCTLPCLMGYNEEERHTAELISHDTGDPAICEFHWMKMMNSGFDPRGRISGCSTPSTMVSMDVGRTPNSNPTTPRDLPDLVRGSPQRTPVSWSSSNDSNPESRVSSFRGTPLADLISQTELPISQEAASTIMSHLTGRIDAGNGTTCPMWPAPYGPPTRPTPRMTSDDIAQVFGAPTPPTPAEPSFPTKAELEIAELVFRLLNHAEGDTLPTVRVTMYADDLLFDTADGSALRSWLEVRDIIKDVLTRPVPDPRWAQRRHTFIRNIIPISADFARMAEASTRPRMDDTTSASTVLLLDAPPQKTPAGITPAMAGVAPSVWVLE